MCERGKGLFRSRLGGESEEMKKEKDSAGGIIMYHKIMNSAIIVGVEIC